MASYKAGTKATNVLPPWVALYMSLSIDIEPKLEFWNSQTRTYSR